jgi:phosphodiesterase/alkaline phosphatase D-like protein
MSIRLGPIVGSTTHNEARIWVQTHEPMALECRVYTDSEGNNQVPDSPFVFRTEAENGNTGVATLALPQDDKKYYYRIFEKKGDSSIQISQILCFRTFPAPDKKIESISFGLISCHKPKKFDYEKELNLRNMWRSLSLEMSRHDAGFLLMAGDQVYADHKKFNAWKKSLKGSSRESSLELYRDVYYKHWAFTMRLQMAGVRVKGMLI